MSQLVVATADVDFEDRVRDAFEGELEGQVRTGAKVSATTTA